MRRRTNMELIPKVTAKVIHLHRSDSSERSSYPRGSTMAAGQRRAVGRRRPRFLVFSSFVSSLLLGGICAVGHRSWRWRWRWGWDFVAVFQDPSQLFWKGKKIVWSMQRAILPTTTAIGEGVNYLAAHGRRDEQIVRWLWKSAQLCSPLSGGALEPNSGTR